MFKTPEITNAAERKKKKESKKRQLEMPRKSENSKPTKSKRKLDPGQRKLDQFRVIIPKLDTCSPVKNLKCGMYSPVKIIDEPDKESIVIHDDDIEVKKTKRSLDKELTTTVNPVVSPVSQPSTGHSQKLLDFTEKKSKKKKDNSKCSSKLSPKRADKKPSKKGTSKLLQISPSKSSNLLKAKSPLKFLHSLQSPKSPKSRAGKSLNLKEKSSSKSTQKLRDSPLVSNSSKKHSITVEDDDFIKKTPKKKLKLLQKSPVDKVKLVVSWFFLGISFIEHHFYFVQCFLPSRRKYPFSQCNFSTSLICCAALLCNSSF